MMNFVREGADMTAREGLVRNDEEQLLVERKRRNLVAAIECTLAWQGLAMSMLPPGTPGLCENISIPLFSCALHHTRVTDEQIPTHRYLGCNFMPSIGMKFRNR